MKRRTIKLSMLVLALLLLGAIVNVAVAWGCALSSHCDPKSAFYQDEVPESIKTVVPKGWLLNRKPGATLIRVNQNQDLFGVTNITTGAIESYDGEWIIGPGRVIHLIRAGWPSRALTCWGRIDSSPFGTAPIQEWIGGSCVDRVGQQSRIPAIPFLPIWPGFAINTIFYAAILWVVFAVPLALRRRRRIKRGQCPACAYPIGTSPVCTECGTKPEPRPHCNLTTSPMKSHKAFSLATTPVTLVKL